MHAASTRHAHKPYPLPPLGTLAIAAGGAVVVAGALLFTFVAGPVLLLLDHTRRRVRLRRAARAAVCELACRNRGLL